MNWGNEFGKKKATKLNLKDDWQLQMREVVLAGGVGDSVEFSSFKSDAQEVSFSKLARNPDVEGRAQGTGPVTCWEVNGNLKVEEK